MLRDKIKGVCEAKGITQRELARESGVPYTAIKEWNDHMPNALDLVRVAMTLGMSAEELLKDELEL